MERVYNSRIIWLPLLGFAAAAAGLSLLFDFNLFVSTLLFWGVSGVYLSFVSRQAAGPALVFSVVATVTFGLLVDYLGFINYVWYTPDSVFSFRFFGLVPVENFLWALLYVYTVVMVYESLAGRGGLPSTRKRFWVISAGLAVISVAVHWAARRFPGVLSTLSFPYLTFGIAFFLLPSLIFLAKFPAYAANCLRTAGFIFPIAFINELVALQLGHWHFPPQAELIGRLGIFGAQIPIEELVFFILIGPLGILTYYLLFFSDASRQ